MKSFEIEKLVLGPDINEDCGLYAKDIRFERGKDSAAGPKIIIGFFNCSKCSGCKLETLENVNFQETTLGIGISLGNAAETVGELILSQLAGDDICGKPRPGSQTIRTT